MVFPDLLLPPSALLFVISMAFLATSSAKNLRPFPRLYCQRSPRYRSVQGKSPRATGILAPLIVRCPSSNAALATRSIHASARLNTRDSYQKGSRKNLRDSFTWSNVSPSRSGFSTGELLSLSRTSCPCSV